MKRVYVIIGVILFALLGIGMYIYRTQSSPQNTGLVKNEFGAVTNTQREAGDAYSGLQLEFENDNLHDYAIPSQYDLLVKMIRQYLYNTLKDKESLVKVTNITADDTTGLISFTLRSKQLKKDTPATVDVSEYNRVIFTVPGSKPVYKKTSYTNS